MKKIVLGLSLVTLLLMFTGCRKEMQIAPDDPHKEKQYAIVVNDFNIERENV